MDINFNNKVAVITGAGSGLGRSYAIELASRGAKVVVNDVGSSINGTCKSEKTAQHVVDQIKAKGGEAVADFNNVADEKSAHEIIKTALDNFGTVDILINNAGIIKDRSFINMSFEDFDLIMKIHLYGAFFVTKAAFPIMKDKKYGRIVNTTSVSGLYGNFGQVNYAAAKLGIVGLMNALKEEGKDHNILVNTIAPIAYTRISAGSLPPEIAERVKPEYVSAMVAYLCSDICKVSGNIISVCSSYYTREQIVQGKGYFFGKNQDVTAEMIAEKYDVITDMKEIRSFNNLSEALEKLFQYI